LIAHSKVSNKANTARFKISNRGSLFSVPLIRNLGAMIGRSYGFVARCLLLGSALLSFGCTIVQTTKVRALPHAKKDREEHLRPAYFACFGLSIYLG
jgi:hypothetical protein